VSEDLETRVEILVGKLEGVEAERDRLREEVAELRKWNDALRAEVVEMVNERDELQQERDMLKAELAEVKAQMADMVELPRDADGVVIRVGDVVESEDGDRGEVCGLNFDGECWFVVPRGRLCEWAASLCRHMRPDSWERLAESVRAALTDAYNMGNLDGTIIGVGDINVAQTADELVERAKALGGAE